jgi:hypothetical protein
MSLNERQTLLLCVRKHPGRRINANANASTASGFLDKSPAAASKVKEPASEIVPIE